MLQTWSSLDPPDTINPRKDTSLAIMTGQKRLEISFFSLQDLQVDNGHLFISSHRVSESAAIWHTVLGNRKSSSKYFDAILIRKDPPFDMNYVYSTYL